jgi:hypothetical protein
MLAVAIDVEVIGWTMWSGHRARKMPGANARQIKLHLHHALLGATRMQCYQLVLGHEREYRGKRRCDHGTVTQLTAGTGFAMMHTQ